MKNGSEPGPFRTPYLLLTSWFHRLEVLEWDWVFEIVQLVPPWTKPTNENSQISHIQVISASIPFQVSVETFILKTSSKFYIIIIGINPSHVHTENETENKEIETGISGEKTTDPREDTFTSEDSRHKDDTFSDTVSRQNKSATPNRENESIVNGVMSRKGTGREEDTNLVYFVTNHFHCRSCHLNPFYAQLQ